jgi:hypothetical protein
MGETLGFITKGGGWSTWNTPTGEAVKFQGWDGFLEKVVPHPEYQALTDMVMNAL